MSIGTDPFQLDTSREDCRRDEGELRRLNEELACKAAHLEQVNRTLVDSEQRLRLAVATGRIGLWVWNSTDVGNAGDWSPRLKEIFGMAPETEVTHEIFLQCVHPEDRERVNTGVMQALAGVNGGEYACEYRAIRASDGAQRWVTARGQAFFDAEGQPVRFIGTLMDVTERKSAEDDSRRAAVMAERNRLARDIHDTLAQGFTGVIIQLQAAADARSRGLAVEADEHIQRAGDLARDSLGEARRSVRALRPRTLEKMHFCDALRALLGKITAGTPLRAELILHGEPWPMLPEWEENLLRICQEVLTNALRHARASQLDAVLTFSSAGLRLDLRDDGCGFDPAARHEGFGLLGMGERVEGMGGRLTIESGPGKGTVILIHLPLPDPSSHPV